LDSDVDDDDDYQNSDDDDDECQNNHDADVDDECQNDAEEPATEEHVPASAESAPPKRSVTFGNVQVREHSVTLGDHPLCDNFPLTLDWAHTEMKEYDLDWYEETKRKGEWCVPTGRGRMLQLEDVTGVDRSVWRWREGRRLQQAKQQKLLQLVVEMEQQEQKRARVEEREAARLHQPVRRSPRLAKTNTAPPREVVRRRSGRLATKAHRRA
jgi:hypothetical protein